MELYFIRHAIAVDRMDRMVHSDEERWLTEKGGEKMRRAAEGFAEIVGGVDCIYTSSYVRARQTADIVQEALIPKPPVEVTDLLIPGAGERQIERLTRKTLPNARLAFVGHEPDFSEIISMLVSGTLNSGILMKKGAICRVDITNVTLPGNGLLVWHMQPKQLRALGK